MKRPTIKLRINTDGTVECIYSDAALPILQALVIDPKDVVRQTHRASIVDPHPDGWPADMSPSGHDVRLGPYPTRQEALDAEATWLDKNVIMRGMKSNE